MIKRGANLMLIVCLGASFGCANMSDVQRGAAHGGVHGAVAGAIYGEVISAAGAVEGGGIGLLAGALIGALLADPGRDGVQIPAYEDRLADLTRRLDDATEAQRGAESREQGLLQDAANLQRQIDALQERLARAEQASASTPSERGAAERIEITLSADALFESGNFSSGSAVLTDAGQGLLDGVAATLKSDHAGKKIEIQGHTDTDPIEFSDWRSNWELGAARSLAVLHYLEDKHGIASANLAASSFSMHRPIAGNDTDEGKAANRRAVIVIYPQWPGE